MPGLAESARLVANRDVSSVDLVTESLRRIEAAQPVLNPFRVVRAEAALAEAEAADRRYAAGERAPLLGVPVAVKDDADVTGEPTAFGCAGDFPPATVDSEVVRLLRAAGAVIVGKTNTPEFGQWPFTEGAAFGVTRNPWDPAYCPGGSSGGAAAAVAAGLVPAALGSDGAGSVRIPAAWTHLVGVKPQRGRLSGWPDAEQFHGITTFGPLARTVGDAALLLQVCSGNTDGDAHTARPIDAVAAAARAPGPLRVGLSLRPAFTGLRQELHPAARAAVERIAGALEGLGHHVVPAEPRYGLIGANFIPRSLVGVRDWARRVPDVTLLDPRSRQNARTGALLGDRAVAVARAMLPRLASSVGRIFAEVDVLLTPTTAVPPQRVATMSRLSGVGTDRAMIAACPYCWPWNVLGWPGVNVPAGFTDTGLPMGAQLLGPGDSDGLLLSLAAQLESAERWHAHRPPALPASNTA